MERIRLLKGQQSGFRQAVSCASRRAFDLPKDFREMDPCRSLEASWTCAPGARGCGEARDRSHSLAPHRIGELGPGQSELLQFVVVRTDIASHAPTAVESVPINLDPDVNHPRGPRVLILGDTAHKQCIVAISVT